MSAATHTNVTVVYSDKPFTIPNKIACLCNINTIDLEMKYCREMRTEEIGGGKYSYLLNGKILI